MDKKDALHLLEVLVEYFEAGNQRSDALAKDVIESDFVYLEHWRAAMRRLKAEGEWTGLRAPEAEILVAALAAVQQMLDHQS